MIPDPEKVRFWQERAHAYDGLCRGAEIFSRLSIRLIEMLPADLKGPVLDIGAGSGLTSELLLARRPRCEAILVDPSAAMIDVARARLAGRPAQFLVMGLDEAAALDLRASAALASVSMQFVDLASAFAAWDRVIAPGGHVAFNLWWHHWEETADGNGMSGWLPVAQAACREARLPPPAAAASPPRAKTRAELATASAAHGFRTLAEHRDVDEVSVAVGLDFQAMGADWPVKGLSSDERQAVLRRMHELARGQTEKVVSTRFLLQRSNRPPTG